jgi:hypothetical protein
MHIPGRKIGGDRIPSYDLHDQVHSRFSSLSHKSQRTISLYRKTSKTHTSFLTMNSIKYACSLNNRGVDFLVSGQSARATKAFQSAVGLLEKAVNDAERTCTGLLSQEAMQPFCESISTVPGLQDVDMHCYVYDHGIIITDTSNGKSDEMLALYTAIVLFNLALTSHCQGLLGGEKSLKKASLLYSMAEQLLRRCTIPEDASTTILTLLALNNKAQIHYDQCEYVHSVDCMKTILKIMGSVQDLHSTLGSEDLEGILLNVVLLDAPTAAQAA